MIRSLQSIGQTAPTSHGEQPGFSKPVKTPLEHFMRRPEKLNVMSRRDVINVAKAALKELAATRAFRSKVFAKEMAKIACECLTLKPTGTFGSICEYKPGEKTSI